VEKALRDTGNSLGSCTETTPARGAAPGALPDVTLELCQLRWLDDALKPLSGVEEALRFFRAKAMGARRRVFALLSRVFGLNPEPYGGRLTWEELADGTSRPVIRGRVVMGLKAGDTVEVLSLDDIRATLDEKGKHDGLKFLRPMAEFCDRRFVVLKPVRQILDEHNHVMQKTKRTVILDGAICHGQGIYGREGCDRSCFFFWKEAWLRKVEE
jgi:hypothetical protein